MALFTANGILVGETRFRMRGIGGMPSGHVPNAYQDWMKTQYSDIGTVKKYERYTKEGGFSWLLDVPELYSRRAPGNTCLSALSKRAKPSLRRINDDYIVESIDGDYAHLKRIDEEGETLVARALLPQEIMEGIKPPI